MFLASEDSAYFAGQVSLLEMRRHAKAVGCLWLRLMAVWEGHFRAACLRSMPVGHRFYVAWLRIVLMCVNLCGMC